jgi:ubiquinone/menaquinone biosynthesis C-methylase UbiE
LSEAPEDLDETVPSHIAFQTWEANGESLASVEQRIHDGITGVAELHQRADDYLDAFEAFFPEARPKIGGELMEIGPGVGYIMEAALRRYAPSRFVGLDVAAGMIDKAKERLARDSVDTRAIEFVHYDGVNVPLPSDSFDFIYSVASLLHAPRAFCFRALMEAHRLIKPSGAVCIELVAYSHFETHMTRERFAREIDQQVRGTEGHWHHYYTSEEIEAVLRYGVGVEQLRVRERGGSLFFCFWGSSSVAVSPHGRRRRRMTRRRARST